jgi:hypothetical protein
MMSPRHRRVVDAGRIESRATQGPKLLLTAGCSCFIGAADNCALHVRVPLDTSLWYPRTNPCKTSPWMLRQRFY